MIKKREIKIESMECLYCDMRFEYDTIAHPRRKFCSKICYSLYLKKPHQEIISKGMDTLERHKYKLDKKISVCEEIMKFLNKLKSIILLIICLHGNKQIDFLVPSIIYRPTLIFRAFDEEDFVYYLPTEDVDWF